MAYLTQYSNKAAITKEEWLLETANVEQWNIPDPVVYRNQAELYRKVPAVVTACDMTGKLGAPQKYKVMQYKSDEETVEINNHPFEQLLNNPNPMDSGLEFRRATIIGKMLAGNFFWWLNKTDESAAPTEIWAIPQDRIKPVPDERMYLRGYLYDPGFGQGSGYPGHPESFGIPLETWEVVHFKRYNPFNPFVGLSMLESLAMTGIGDIAAREWNSRYFGQNNARLEGMLLFADPINDTDWRRLQQQFKDAAAKREQMMLRGIGKGGVEWKQAAATKKDMDFLAGLRDNTETMYNVIAPGLASMLAINANVANSETGERIFRNFTVWPELEDISNKIEQKILPLYGENLRGEFEDVRITDRMLELKEQETYAITHTIDEIRAEFYQQDPLGDERGNLLPAEIKNKPSFSGAAPQPVTADSNNAQADEPDEPMKAEYLEEMGKFRRYALKRIGKDLKFSSDVIPSRQLDEIAAKLKSCGTEKQVNQLFDGYLDDGNTDALAIVESMRLAVEAIKATVK